METAILYCPECRSEYEFPEYREPVYCGRCKIRFDRRVKLTRDLTAEGV